jgi:iron complex outermembrane receptor protein
MLTSQFHGPRRALALALGAALAVLATPSSAQTGAALTPPQPTVLDPVVVTGNPLRSRELAAPISVLAGDELVLRRGSSLGETLNGQPGVSSSYFGPNANRPIIRGLDGDRVRIQSNGSASLDASALSFDHAVPIDPLVVERIEVLRGPAALMYGGSAMGGVVNALDNRVPKAKIDGPGGAAEVRFGGAERERGGAALIETGNGRLALHADAFGRQTSDLRVPNYTPVEDGAPLAPADRVRNSAARAGGGALGAAITSGSGYLGLAADTYDSRYGVVAEPDVVIRMRRDHLALAGEMRDLGGALRSLRAQLNRSRYEHREIEGSGAVGTTFATSGTEARLELEHAALGPLRGVFGLQLEAINFSALGEEAFVPSTRTRRQGRPGRWARSPPACDSIARAWTPPGMPIPPRPSSDRRARGASRWRARRWPTGGRSHGSGACRPRWPPRSARRPRSSSLPMACMPPPGPTSAAILRSHPSAAPTSTWRCNGNPAPTDGARACAVRASHATVRGRPAGQMWT